MAVHVDDFIYGGTPTFINTVIAQLRSIFKIGLEESEGMKYLGISIKQNLRGISLSTDAYCSSLKEIVLLVIVSVKQQYKLLSKPIKLFAKQGHMRCH